MCDCDRSLPQSLVLDCREIGWMQTDEDQGRFGEWETSSCDIGRSRKSFPSGVRAYAVIWFCRPFGCTADDRMGLFCISPEP
ncbi:unnamed protein product [Microthlaspi erraticum]|uniref:Uncharacterized protein n=1 Tax=Microthlaspi erraticum TaxID=1685480 RepID=A0A6D2KEF3_9BRAS|nr:unnamed protein product [Microthlaspi erraticum]